MFLRRLLLTWTLLLTGTSAFYPYHRVGLTGSDGEHIASARSLDIRSESVGSARRRDFLRPRANAYHIDVAIKPTLPDTAPIDEDGNDISYFTTMQFGTSGKPLHIMLDSGAANSWVMGSDCTTKACGAHTTFGAADSSSLQTTGQAWNVTYGKGTVSGQVVNDTVSVAGFNITLSFGSATQVSDEFLGYTMDGMLGLSRPDPTEANIPTFMGVLASTGKLKANVVGINLQRAADNVNDGEVTFGAWDKTKFTGDLAWTNAVAPNGLWEIPVDDAAVGGQSAKLSGKTALIDTGTSYILMPPDDAKALHAQFPQVQQNGESFAVPCSSTQPIQLTFSGKSYDVLPKDYLGPPSGTAGLCYTFVIGHQYSGANQWLVGDTFLKNVYTVFDYDQNRVGFAVKTPSAPSSTSSSSSSPSHTGGPSAPTGGMGPSVVGPPVASPTSDTSGPGSSHSASKTGATSPSGSGTKSAASRSWPRLHSPLLLHILCGMIGFIPMFAL